MKRFANFLVDKRLWLFLGSVVVAITLSCGFIMEGAVASILETLCVGSFSALLLVVFVLPSLLAMFDRFVVKKKKA